MGESRSFMSWYPLSRNAWPKLFSSGHAVWHAEHGRPYFLAKAGMASTFCTGSATTGCIAPRNTAAPTAALAKVLQGDELVTRLAPANNRKNDVRRNINPPDR